ncbi:membrane protein [Lentzea waywayandensis]|uniref:Membrane protein n=1 Tax=Lentzea waywayandensis TaxID=84724 RepID=A0A1I6FF47_9PSEU|nr:MmpS family transport accessory protein [Lentzea waywayandensis]SFR28387.1 membrane protein [Lentzea waywayandensis]
MAHQPPEYGIAPPLHEPPRSSKWPWVLLLITVLVVAGALAFGNHVTTMLERTFSSSDSSSTGTEVPLEPVESPAPATRTVVFEVTGTGKAFNVTATVGASIHNEASVTLPWTRTVEVPAGPAAESVMLVVVAGPDGAEVHGKYTIDGTTVREGKASGPYGVLTITDS